MQGSCHSASPALSLGAALVDIDRAKGQIVNSLAPLSGMAIGAIGTSALIQYGPEPLHLVYALLLAAFAVQAVALWLTRETGGTRPGVFNSLKPTIFIPQQVKKPLSLVTPINIANWTLGGFYLSLVPSLVASTTGSRAPLTGGAVVAALMLSGAIAVFLRRNRSPKANLIFGVAQHWASQRSSAGVHLANVPLLLVGTLLTGAGFGTNFLGSIGTIMPLAKPEERAGLLSAFYIQSYLAFSLPAILAGFLVKSIGYGMTTDIYATAIVLVSLAGLMVMRATKERRRLKACRDPSDLPRFKLLFSQVAIARSRTFLRDMLYAIAGCDQRQPSAGATYFRIDLDDVGIVFHAELVGDGQQQRIGLGDRLVLLQLLNESIGLGGIGTAEDRPRILVDEADLVLPFIAIAEIGAVAIVRPARRCCG